MRTLYVVVERLAGRQAYLGILGLLLLGSLGVPIPEALKVGTIQVGPSALTANRCQHVRPRPGFLRSLSLVQLADRRPNVFP